MFNIIYEKSFTESEKCKKILALANEDPNAIFKKDLGLTPLHVAALTNQIEVTKLLLKLGSDINAVEYEGQTPLHIASENGFDDLILVLGYHNPDFNMLDKLHESALHKTIKFNHPTCVKNLLLVSQFKIDITLRDKGGNTAEELMLKISDTKVRTSLDNALHIVPNSSGHTLLHSAVIANAFFLTQSLVSFNAPINEQDRFGKTALHLAAEYNHFEILNLLTKQNTIDMNALDADGNTALHISVRLGHKECVKFLVSARIPTDKNIKNKAGFIASDFFKKSNDEATIALKKAFSSMYVTNSCTEAFEKEVFTFYQITPPNYMKYLSKHLQPLSLSIQMLRDRKKSPRKLSDSSSSKLLRTHSSPRRKSSQDSSSSTEKSRVSFAQNNTNEVIKNPLEKAFSKNDVFQIVNIIKDSENFSLPEFKKMIEKYHNEHTENVLKNVLHELQILSTTRQKELDEQWSLVSEKIHKNLLANGLKENCTTQEINNISKEENDYLQLLTKICSGTVFETYKVTIDLNLVMQKCLGLMDMLEPQVIIAYLRQLHPSFSKIQQLQSHYIVITLMEICDAYGDSHVSTLVSEAVDSYIHTCCDKEIIDNVMQYRRAFDFYQSKSLDGVIQQIKTTLKEDKKESIYSKINEVVGFSSLDLNHNKILQDHVDGIARAFNHITAQLYQSCPFNRFQLKHWDAKVENAVNAQLLEYKELIDKMMIFVRNVITSYKTPLEQAHAITVFTYVARECLHFQYGPDFDALFAIASALEVVGAYCLEGTLALVDEKTKAIHQALKKVIDSFDNYNGYRELLLNSHNALPYIGVFFKDRTFAAEQSTLYARVSASGALTKSLILLKKNLSDVTLVAETDLLLQLKVQKENMDVLDLLKKEAQSLSREPSPRIELSPPTKEPSPRRESSFKLPSLKRRNSSSSQNVHRLSLFKEESLSTSSEEKSSRNSHDTNSK